MKNWFNIEDAMAKRIEAEELEIEPEDFADDEVCVVCEFSKKVRTRYGWQYTCKREICKLEEKR